MDSSLLLSSLSNNLQLCRICITSSTATTTNGVGGGNCGNNCSTQMISIFGEDSLWKKITTLADVKIERGDTLPQHVCITCAKNTISACLFKKKCEDADNFFRQQLLIRKIESKSDQKDIIESESDEGMLNGQNHNENSHRSDDEEEMEEQNYKRQLHRQINGDHRLGGEDNENQSQRLDDHDIVEDDGEIKSVNGQKPTFDFNSIRLMHEYMQQHLSKLNGIQGNGYDNKGSDDEGGAASGSDTEQGDDDEDGPLPLIPEIELITPSEDGGSVANNSNGDATLQDGSTGLTQIRGYPCPHCFQIFEMKQVLKAHMQSVHGASGPVYECTNCKKTYFYKRFLEKHIRRGRCVKKRRNQTRPMQCSDCNVLFPTGHHLGWHKRTGCPSKTSKMPLQQLFKQNIVQYNNFPRRIGIRKPENAIYLHNRKIIMANNKRKGRTRIKLDAKKIALAKQLILREATTTVIANELNISRTFAWRLRKSLVNGVSLHERVIDPPEDEEEEDNDFNGDQMDDGCESLNLEKPENQLNHQPFTEHIKRERGTSDDDDDDEGEECQNNNQECENRDNIHEHHRHQLEDEQHQQQHHIEQQEYLRQSDGLSVATSVIQRTNELKTNNIQEQQQQQLSTTKNAILEQHKLHNKISVVQQQRLMEINKNAHLQNNDIVTDTDTDNDDATSNHHYQRHAQQLILEQHQETELINSQQQQQQKSLYLQQTSTTTTFKEPQDDAHPIPMSSNSKLPLMTHLSSAVATAIHQLPVNLSIRPIASMQNTSDPPTNNVTGSKKKPRKPNVFIDDEKYAMAKMLVAQNASTMEIAKALNVSQMTAWKLRDAIIKGVPLSYRNRRDIRMTVMRHDEDSASVLSEGSDIRRESDTERQQQALLVQQQLDHQQKLQQQHLQQQQQIQQLLQRQQQLQQQQQQLEQQKQQKQQEREQQLLLQQQQQQQHQRQQQRQQQQQQKQHHHHQQKQQQQPQPMQQIQQQQEQKIPNPRRRLKAAEREVRDKEITREILELIKEDNNIQYWKVSARLAEKGYAISPSSVCQKLKSMGIHRRWKPGDKPPLIDMEQLKAVAASNNTNLNNGSSMAALVTTTSNAQNASSSADESYEPQFDMGGVHFLSAFTR